MQSCERDDWELAENLIVSLGPLRAAHMARQYGWGAVAREIASRLAPAPIRDMPRSI